MDGNSLPMIIALVILVIMSAYFSATETAFSSLNRIRLKSLANNGHKKAALVLKLSENYDKLLSTILIGNNIVNIASASMATVIFTVYWGDAGVTLSTIVMTIVVLIFGEISPKSLAKEAPEQFAQFSAPILNVLIWILTPLNFLFTQWKRLLSKVFKAKQESGITEEELKTMVDEAQSGGGIGEHEGELIRAAIEFNDLDAGDILTPRVDIMALNEDSGMEQISDLFVETGFSRLPVYRGTIDNIIGLLHEKDFYSGMRRGCRSIQQLIHPVIYIAENTKISALLRSLQKAKTHMAVVVDEFGGTSGIVTLEDMLEELVGDIWDEHDEIVFNFVKQDDGSWLINCNADADDFFEKFGLTGDCESSTVNGWVTQQLGHVPREGDEFEFQGISVVVTKTDPRRVLEIQVNLRETAHV